jgi:hypothetical protein
MLLPNVHCVVVEVPTQGSSQEHRCDQPQDLLPWADPYIAQLLVKHQMQLAAEERRQGLTASHSDRFTAGAWSEASPPFEELPGPDTHPPRRDDWSRKS